MKDNNSGPAAYYYCSGQPQNNPDPPGYSGQPQSNPDPSTYSGQPQSNPRPPAYSGQPQSNPHPPSYSGQPQSNPDPPAYPSQLHVNLAYNQDSPYYYPSTQNMQTPYRVNPQQSEQGYPISTVANSQPQSALVGTVDNHMGLAIFATLCCCCPLGLFAIIRASEVESALAVSDISRAQRLSKQSKSCSELSIFFGIIIIIFVSILAVGLHLKS